MPSWSHEAGLELLPIGTREQYIELSQHPDLWHPMRGVKLVLGTAAGGFVRPIYELVAEHYVPGDTVLCAHALDLGSRVAGEKLRRSAGVRRFRAGHDLERLRFAAAQGRAVRAACAASGSSGCSTGRRTRLFVLPLVGGELNGLRRELGLPPVKRVFRSGSCIRRRSVLGLFPDWFGPPQPDWPREHAAGRAFRCGTRTTRPSCRAKCENFWRPATPPIAFSPGSANREAHQFFAAAVEACERIGRRGILLTKYAEQLPANLPRVGAALWFRAAEPAAAAHGGAGASRRHRHRAQGLGGRRAAPGAADGVRSIRQFAATGAAGCRRKRFR